MLIVPGKSAETAPDKNGTARENPEKISENNIVSRIFFLKRAQEIMHQKETEREKSEKKKREGGRERNSPCK